MLKWSLETEEPNCVSATTLYVICDNCVPFLRLPDVHLAIMVASLLNSHESHILALQKTQKELLSWLSENIATIKKLEAEIAELKKPEVKDEA